MGFWNSYFKYGLGDKLKSTIGTVMLRHKFNNLLDKYRKTPTYDQQPTAPQESDTGQLPVDGTPQQDLQGDSGQNTVETPPPVDTQPQGFMQYQPKTITPLGENPVVKRMGIGGSVSSNKKPTPLLSNNDKSKVDFSAIQSMLDPNARSKYNENLSNDVLSFLSDAQRFPELAPQYQSLASSLFGIKNIKEPTTPKFDEKQMFTDKNGMLYQYKYNPYKGLYSTVPVSDETGKQIQTKLPETQDLSKLNYYEGEDGNAWYKDPVTGEDKSTGVDYRRWDKTFALREAELNAKVEGDYFKKYPPKWMSGNTGNGRGSNNGSSNDIIAPNGNFIHIKDPEGKVTDLSKLPAQIQTLIRNMGSKKKKTSEDAKSKLLEWGQQYGYTVDFTNESPTVKKQVQYDITTLQDMLDEGKISQEQYDAGIEKVKQQAPYSYEIVTKNLDTIKRNVQQIKEEHDRKMEHKLNRGY